MYRLYLLYLVAQLQLIVKKRKKKKRGDPYQAQVGYRSRLSNRVLYACLIAIFFFFISWSRVNKSNIRDWTDIVRPLAEVRLVFLAIQPRSLGVSV